MVKGVNKTIIEINNTGSKYFDRVLLFVNPAYAAVPQSRLETKAAEIIGAAEPLGPPRPKRRRRKIRIRAVLPLLLIAAAALLIILLK